MTNKCPNFGPLLKTVEEKTQKTKQKVEASIRELIKRQKEINFNSVTEESGVSKSFLYKHQDLRQQIESLRKQQEGLRTARQVKREMSDTSKDVVILSLRSRIKELEEQNKKLNEQLKVRFGDFYKDI